MPGHLRLGWLTVENRDYHYLSRFEISGSYPDQQGSDDCPISLPKCPLKRAEGEGFDLLAPAAVDVALRLPEIRVGFDPVVENVAHVWVEGEQLMQRRFN